MQTSELELPNPKFSNEESSVRRSNRERHLSQKGMEYQMERLRERFEGEQAGLKKLCKDSESCLNAQPIDSAVVSLKRELVSQKRTELQELCEQMSNLDPSHDTTMKIRITLDELILESGHILKKLSTHIKPVFPSVAGSRRSSCRSSRRSALSAHSSCSASSRSAKAKAAALQIQLAAKQKQEQEEAQLLKYQQQVEEQRRHDEAEAKRIKRSHEQREIERERKRQEIDRQAKLDQLKEQEEEEKRQAEQDKKYFEQQQELERRRQRLEQGKLQTEIEASLAEARVYEEDLSLDEVVAQFSSIRTTEPSSQSHDKSTDNHASSKPPDLTNKSSDSATTGLSEPNRGVRQNSPPSSQRENSKLSPLAQSFFPSGHHKQPHIVGPASQPNEMHEDDCSRQSHSHNPLTIGSTAEPSMLQFAEVLASAIATSRLPVPEPPIFHGDPLQYTEWKASFSTLISQRGIPENEKLHFLRRYIDGQARKAVEGFFLNGSSSAFSDAMAALEKRYGDPFTVAESFRHRLDKWPSIRDDDCDGLREFSDFLQQCTRASQRLSQLYILNDAREIQKLAVKLPRSMQKPWIREIARTKASTGAHPTFSAFADFVQLESDAVNDPIVRLTSRPPSAKPGEPPGGKGDSVPKPRRQVFHTKTDTEDPPRPAPITCSFCKRLHHHVSVCRQLQKKGLEERKEHFKRERLCYGCANTGHLSNQCKERCKCKLCGKAHPTCLHGDQPPIKKDGNGNHGDTPSENAHLPPPPPSLLLTQDSSGETPSATVRQNVTSGQSGLTSMIVPVYLSSKSNPSTEILVYALLDTMSDSTFVVEPVVEHLSAPSTSARLRVTTITDQSVSITCNKFTDLQVRGYGRTRRVSLPHCYSRNDIPLDRGHIPSSESASGWSHLRHLREELPPRLDCPVGILIGYNCPQALAPLRCISGESSAPYAVETCLGWSIVGGSNSQPEFFDSFGQSYRLTTQTTSISGDSDSAAEATVHRTKVVETTTADLIKVLEADFKDENPDELALSQEDTKFLRLMKENIRQNEEGHYEMPLPFKNGEPQLPNNRHVALRRALSLKAQLLRRPQYLQHYTTFMNEILSRGDAEKIPADEASSHTCWYIPHHGVYHPHKPNKVRVVFDCSAKYQGTCVNEHLLQGPDLINPLVGVLCRFRQGPVAFTCDVEKMYHQFHVSPGHRDYLRFLWWEDGDLTKDPSDYRMKVHLFGATSSPGCANFALKQLALDHQSLNSRAALFLQRDFYVDDGLRGEATSAAAINLIQGAVAICKKGHLRLHKFMSNCQEVMESIPESERAKVRTADITGDQPLTDDVERTLGVQWQVETDSLRFKLSIKDGPPTRRGVLSTVASIYDPLGLIAPAVLPGRLVLQSMCRDRLCWDDPIPASLLPEWERWKANLKELEAVRIARCFQPKDFGTPTEVQLHHFSDASLSGYGQCSYLRLKNERNDVHCALVTGKSRVSPLKPITVPRLELQAAVLSVTAARFLHSQLEYTNVSHHFWTDSRVVLGYICNESARFHMYVANRVEKIRQSSTPEQWHYVPTDENPADHASRGLTVEQLTESDWFRGPAFLWEPGLSPTTESYKLPADDKEIKVTVRAVTSAESRDFSLESIARKFSCLAKLTSALGALIRRCARQRGDIISQVESRERATRQLLRSAQQDAYAELDPKSRSHPLRAVDPFRDQDGLLRVGGRQTKSAEDFNVKHPLICPKVSHLSSLLIAHSHSQTAHQGKNFTINHIRQSGFWIVGCRRLVVSHIRKCVTCAKHRGKCMGQKMADLPVDRTTPSPPFTYCGLDCFGPFTVKEGRRELKRYGLLLTCLASRAIHIEVLDDLSTDAFMNGLRSFIAIRGRIRLIRCDQGTNFMGARREINSDSPTVDTDSLVKRLAAIDCEFVPNLPAASHMGGVWERQIRTVRSVLTGILDQQTAVRLDTTSLRTVMYEAMAIVNSRPLTVEQLDGTDGPLPLTPNHLLTNKTGITAPPPPGNFEKEDLYLGKRWRRVQYLVQLFWTRWRREYLNTLQSRKKWTEEKDCIQVGDIVLLKDENVCRAEWRVGRVTEAFRSSDGLVRGARLLMATTRLSEQGKPIGKRSYLERPIHKLVVLLRAPTQAV